jgi:hypothetical protein
MGKPLSKKSNLKEQQTKAIHQKLSSSTPVGSAVFHCFIDTHIHQEQHQGNAAKQQTYL